MKRRKSSADESLKLLGKEERSPSIDEKKFGKYNSTYHKFFGVFFSTTKIIHPSSLLRLLWDALVFLAILYNTFSIPIRCTFRILWEENMNLHVLEVIDYFCDVIYIGDILINFRTAYVIDGIPSTDLKKIRNYYFRTWFAIDLISVIPMDLFFWKTWLHAVLRLNRLLKLTRIQGYFENWEKETHFFHLIQFCKLFCAVIIFNQWLGCLYMGLAYLEDFENQPDGANKFLPPKEFGNSFWKLYQYAFFTATRYVSKVGGTPPQPQTDLDRAFLLLTCLFVLFVATAIVAAFVEFVRHLREDKDEWRERIARIKLFMSNKNLSPELAERVLQYYDQLWSRKEGLEEESILEDLPKNLRTEVAFHMNGEIIRKVPFFADATQGFISELVNLLSPEIYSPGEFIVKYGDLASEMYFIKNGVVEVISAANEVLAKLSDGSFFGEIALLYESKRTASIKASSYCDIYVLRKRDLEKVLRRYPEQSDYMMEMADMRIAADSLRELIKKVQIFKKVNHELQNELLRKFHYEPVDEGDLLYEVDDPSERMFFLGKGHVELVDEEGRILRTIQPSQDFQEGAFLGHIDFVLGRPYTVNARVISKCIIGYLEREDFQNLVSKYPEDYKVIINIAQNHSDRITTTFGMQTLKRSTRSLWKRAMIKLKLLRTFSSMGKTHHNRDFLLKVKKLKQQAEDLHFNREQVLKVCDSLSICTQQLFKCINTP